MNTLYANMDIHFSMDHTQIHVPQIVFGCFTKSIPTHSHGSGCYEIHYIPLGHGILMVDDQSYDLSPNTLYVTGPHVKHAQTPITSDPMQEYCVYLKIGSMSQNHRKSSVMDTFVSTPFWIGTDTHGIHLLMKQLFDELAHCYTGHQNLVTLLLSQLLIYVVRNYEQHQLPQASFSQNNKTDAKSVIMEEYFLYNYQSLSLNDLAEQLNLSTRQTQRLLMKFYGKTFQQKKTEARMSAAAMMLPDKTRSITSIAEDLGYSSIEHFSSAFREFYQLSPREYRKRL